MLPQLIYRATIKWLHGVTDEALETLAGRIAELKVSTSDYALAFAERLAAQDARIAALAGEVERLKTPAPTPAPTPTPTPTPTPEPTNDLEVIRTRSGTWRFNLVEKTDEYAVYRNTLDENPAFERFLIARKASLKDEADPTTVDKLPFTAGGIATTLAQGGVRIVQNMDPVAPNAQWLRDAVAEGRLPAYRRERNWRGVAATLKATTPVPYNPLMIAPKADGTEGTANRNYVGVTSPQGGEYEASRGFMHDDDCEVVDAALHGEDDTIRAKWWHTVNLTLYSLAMPGAAMWSMANDVTADPQIPMPGDRPWEVALWSSPTSDDGVDSVQELDSFGRDTAHLENTGYAHWIATEDPVAGLLVQRQFAYALGEYYKYRRPKPMTAYRCYDEQERGYLNSLGAAWKALDVANRINSKAGKILWTAERVQKMADDSIAWIDEKMAKPVRDGTTAREQLTRLVGIPFQELSTTSAQVLPKNADGTYPTAKVVHNSAFMGVQYGLEPLYLWAKAGNKLCADWLAGYARWIVGRLYYCGGSKGVDCAPDVAGSGMMVAYQTPVSGGYQCPYTSLAEYGAWLRTFPTPQRGSAETFENAYAHTAQRCEAMLLAAKALRLNVESLDEAIAHVQATKAKTDLTKLRGPELGSYLKACVDPLG